MTPVKHQNDACCFPCYHLVNNIAGHTSETFQKSSWFDVEDLVLILILSLLLLLLKIYCLYEKNNIFGSAR